MDGRTTRARGKGRAPLAIGRERGCEEREEEKKEKEENGGRGGGGGGGKGGRGGL